MEKFNKITLENGLRIIIVPKPDSLSTTVLVLVEAGSKYETKEINGISHFLEHMCFKGTGKRPKTIDIASELDAIGANYNAFTGQEYTGYYAKAQPKHFDKILDVVSDIYLNSIFDVKEIDKERGVIVEEINMYEDLPHRRVAELFINLLYGDQPAGWDIAGKKEIIQKLSREDFLKYRGEHYLPQATLAVVSGNFNEKIIQSVKEIFVSLPLGKKTSKIKTNERQNKPEILLKSKKTDQTHLVLGVRAYNLFDKRKYALQVLADILGGSMSSRLWQKIREEMGAAYYVRAEADIFTDHGYLAMSAGVDNKRAEEIIKAALEEFQKISKDNNIDNTELQRAKDHLAGQLFLSLESSDEWASFYGSQEILTKQIFSPEEVVEKIQRVKAEEIAAVAKDIFQNNKLNLALIGPFEDKEKFEKILSFD